MAPTALDVLRRRVSDLLEHEQISRKDLAAYLGHARSWTTEFLNASHGCSLDDVDKIARYFGLSVPQLFELDGVRFRDRRRGQRRSGLDRRGGFDRRKAE